MSASDKSLIFLIWERNFLLDISLAWVVSFKINQIEIEYISSDRNPQRETSYKK